MESVAETVQHSPAPGLHAWPLASPGHPGTSPGSIPVHPGPLGASCPVRAAGHPPQWSSAVPPSALLTPCPVPRPTKESPVPTPFHNPPSQSSIVSLHRPVPDPSASFSSPLCHYFFYTVPTTRPPSTSPTEPYPVHISIQYTSLPPSSPDPVRPDTSPISPHLHQNIRLSEIRHSNQQPLNSPPTRPPPTRFTNHDTKTKIRIILFNFIINSNKTHCSDPTSQEQPFTQ